MKLRNYFFGALACLALASCSSDDDAIDSGQETGGKYISVNIATSGTTRGTAGGYEAGITEPDENNITNIILVFYNGNNFLSADEATIKTSSEGSYDPNVEAIATATAYSVPSATNGEPNRIVAIINGGSLITEGNLNMEKPNLEVLQKKIADYGAKTSGKFVMSNSVWEDNNGYTTVTSSNFFASTDLAEASPVDIYVERVNAKVEMTFASGFTTQSSIVYYQDGTNAEVYPIPVKFNLSCTADNSYLVKQLPSGTDWQNGWDWNSSDDKRSFWAKSSATDNQFTHYKYTNDTGENIGVSVGTVTPATPPQAISGKTNHSLALTITETGKFYCLENTLQEKLTKALITTQFHTWNSSTSTLEPYYGDILNWHSTNYNSKSAYLEAVKTEINNYINGATALTLKLIRKDKYSDVTGAKQWEVVADIVETSATLSLKSNSENISIDDLEKILRGVSVDSKYDDVKDYLNSTAKFWGSGRAYYYVDIEHFGIEASGTAYGVVRNHIYRLEFQSMKGLGSPVYDPDPEYDPTKPEDPDPTDPSTPETEDDPKDPDGPEPDEEEPIIPDTPDETEKYLSAKINILKWRIVNQSGIELGK